MNRQIANTSNGGASHRFCHFPWRCLIKTTLFCGLVCSLVSVADAQLPKRTTTSLGRSPRVSKTSVKVEIIAGKQGVGLIAHKWHQVFAKMNVPLRIRPGLLDDKPEIQERKRGRLRQVTAIGRLDRRGNLYFPGHVFSVNDTGKLSEWLRELKTFGKQGTPTNKPLWGLTIEQFNDFYEVLSHRLNNEVQGLSLDDALTKLELPKRYPIRLTIEARKLHRQRSTGKPRIVRQALKGFGKGTAVAIFLNEFGFGFHPLRTPNGGIELSVHPLEKNAKVWPAGWEPKLTRPQTAPGLFEFTMVDLKKVPLIDVLNTASQRAKLPILIDYHEIDANNIELEKLLVSSPPRRTTMIRLLRSALFPHRMTHRLKIDEQGRGFLWITTLEAAMRKR